MRDLKASEYMKLCRHEGGMTSSLAMLGIAREIGTPPADLTDARAVESYGWSVLDALVDGGATAKAAIDDATAHMVARAERFGFKAQEVSDAADFSEAGAAGSATG